MGEEIERYILVIENDSYIPEHFVSSLEAIAEHYKLPIKYAYRAKYEPEKVVPLIDDADVILICPNIVQKDLYLKLAKIVRKRPVKDIIILDNLDDIVDRFCEDDDLRDMANGLLSYGKRIFYGKVKIIIENSETQDKLVLNEAILFVYNYFSELNQRKSSYVRCEEKRIELNVKE